MYIHVFFRDTEEIVEILLNAGANVNARNNKGVTPLMIAVAKGHQKVTKLFLKRPNIDPQQQVKTNVNNSMNPNCLILTAHRILMATQLFIML